MIFLRITFLVVPYWFQEDRSIARFIAYALCAADEALKDANWAPSEQEHKEMTVKSPYLCSIHKAWVFILLFK